MYNRNIIILRKYAYIQELITNLNVALEHNQTLTIMLKVITSKKCITLFLYNYVTIIVIFE